MKSKLYKLMLGEYEIKTLLSALHNHHNFFAAYKTRNESIPEAENEVATSKILIRHLMNLRGGK